MALDRERKTKEENAKEVKRVASKMKTTLHEMLGLSEEDERKFAAQVKNIKLKIHPDKNSEDMKTLAGEAFGRLSSLYLEYTKSVENGLSYKDFLENKRSLEKKKDRDENIYRDKRNYYPQQSPLSPLSPSLQKIKSDIEEYALRTERGEGFKFGSFATFTKIKIEKEGVIQEVPVSATCKKIHEVVTKALSEGKDTKETLESILRIFEKSKKSEQSATRTQKALSFFHIRKRSKTTISIHNHLEDTIRGMLLSYDNNPNGPRSTT